jgi:hypothetical protein
MLVPGTPLYNDFARGEFSLPGKYELIKELRTLIEESQLNNSLFFSNHASNYFPVKARLPKDKGEILRKLDHILLSEDESALRSELMRGL